MKVHASPALESNEKVRPGPDRELSNVAWMERALKCPGPAGGSGVGSVVLIGGANLTHFRMRVAQGHARSDLLPSYWSHAAILVDTDELKLSEVSLEPPGGFRGVPRSQGIQSGCFAAYDDPARFPNVALLQFTLNQDCRERRFDSVGELIRRLHKDRGTVDVLAPLWKWLGYVWGVEGQPNPMLEGVGIPSAILVETVFAMIGIELTPGLASQSSCPEAIWQAAKWWGEFYDSEATLTAGRPSGRYCVRQPAAAVTSEDSVNSEGDGGKDGASESKRRTCGSEPHSSGSH